MNEERDIGALVESAATGIREAVQDVDLTAPSQRKAAIRRVLRDRSIGLDEDELCRFLDQLRAQFPDRAYEEDRERHRMARELAEAKDALRRALEQNEALRHADSARSATVHTIAGAIARGVNREVSAPSGRFEDPEAVERIVFALARFALRQEEVTRVTLTALPNDPATSTSDLADAVVAALGGEADAIEAFDRRIAWVGSTPGALIAAAQQSWKSGTQRVLEFLSPVRAEERVGGSIVRAPAVVRTLKERNEEFWNDFDGHVDSFYRAAFNNMLRSRMGDQGGEKQ